MSSAKAHLQLPAQESFIEPFLGFLRAFARGLSMSAGPEEQLLLACQKCLDLVMKRQTGVHAADSLTVDIFEEGGRVAVEIVNRGIPILHNYHGFQEIAANLDRISVENCGRRGQVVLLEKSIGKGSLALPLPAQEAVRQQLDVAPEDITIRPLAPGEETRLSQLFYFVYGYNYINEYVYYPEKLEQMIKDGKLISMVAVLGDGRLVGHVGLVRWNDDPPVYEAALGLVDPLVKSRGLFGRIFEACMEIAHKTPMQYCFFDFVTNHDYSQKLVSKYGTQDLAVFVGCQRSSTQASLEKLGIGKDPSESDRYSLLLSVIPRCDHPFGKQVELPDNIGVNLGFLLEPLGLRWVPTSRFAALPGKGEYRAKYQPQQDAVLFDVHVPGREALAAVVEDWQRLRRNGYRYAAVEMPVDAPGLGLAHDFLAAAGFFVAGFIPYHLEARLGFRFQSVGPAQLAFPEIRVATPTAKKLLAHIQRDHERTAVV